MHLHLNSCAVQPQLLSSSSWSSNGFPTANPTAQQPSALHQGQESDLELRDVWQLPPSPQLLSNSGIFNEST